MVGSFESASYFANGCSSGSHSNDYVWYTLHTPDSLILNVDVRYATLQLLSGSCSNYYCIQCEEYYDGGCVRANVTTDESEYFLGIANAYEQSALFYELNINVEIIKPGSSCNAAGTLNLPLYTPVTTYISTSGYSVSINDACYGPSYKSPTYWTKINVYATSGSNQFQLSINTCSTKTDIDTLIEVVSACTNGICYAKSTKCSGTGGTLGASLLTNLYYGVYYVGMSSGNSTTGEIYTTFTAIPLTN